MEEMRKQILKYLEKNSRVALGELAVLLDCDETDIANVMAQMEKEKIRASIRRPRGSAIIRR